MNLTTDTLHSPAKSPLSLAESYAYCERLAHSHYENFPVGSRLIPRPLRPHIYSIYAFARTADDFADEPGLNPDERLKKLQDWEIHLDRCQAAPQGPIFTALAETIRTHQLPIQLLKDLLTAFKTDVNIHHHRTFDDLLSYCRYSANPVGRLILHLFGYREKAIFQYSDAICTALQLANFWQDISIDFSRDRIYLPQKDMEHFGVTKTMLKEGCVSKPFQNLLELELDRTCQFFSEGFPLLSQIRGRLRLELRLTWLGGMEILKKIRRNRYDIFKHRPTIQKGDLPRLLLCALLPFFWKRP